MIYTITLNPALDRIVEVEGLVPDDTNRIQRESRYAGGKGIDVSRVLRELGDDSIALGFVGGYDGLELEGRLIQEGVRTDFTKISEETRTNIIIFDRSRGTQTSLNAPGPTIKPHELALFFQKLEHLVPMPTMVVISGSIPPGVPVDIYARIIHSLKDQGVRVVLDADGEPLRRGVRALPFMIKPNIYELGRLVGGKLAEDSEVLEAARSIQRQGVEIVVVSLGGRGALAVSKEGSWRAVPPPVEVQSTVGAGDSLVAGFVYRLTRGAAIPECLRFGVACGTAAALTPGNELCHREDVHRLLPEVQVEEV